ncbi:uncharacterized protein LOC141901791 [Tubulanus polymorphus]|uniref:uncharacterized protein LOC141901791 n=1 Tax=Tubulanus polymorphus TaxID=672921 RepID=UPI003DA4EE27
MGMDEEETDDTDSATELRKLGYAYYCAQRADCENLRKLINQGFDIAETLTAESHCPLYFAVLYNHIDVVELLLQYYVPKVSRKSNYLLNIAINGESSDPRTNRMVDVLLKSGVSSSDGSFIFIPEGETLTLVEREILSLLENGGKYPRKETCLNNAVEKRNREAVDIILDWNYPQNIDDPFTIESVKSVLYSACRPNTITMLNQLLSRKEMRTNLPICVVTTMFNAAMQAGNKDALEALLNIEGMNYSKLVQLKSYCVLGRVADVEKLLEDLSEIVKKRRDNESGFERLLFLCAKGGNCRVFDMVYEAAAEEIDNVVLSKCTSYAAQHDQTDMFKRLVELGADPFIVDENEREECSALEMCYKSGSLDILDILLEKRMLENMDYERCVIRGCYTNPFCILPMYATDDSSSRFYAMAVRLMEYLGNLVNIADRQGRTPLMMACSHGNIAMIELLLVNGADVLLSDNKGMSCFSHLIDFEDRRFKRHNPDDKTTHMPSDTHIQSQIRILELLRNHIPKKPNTELQLLSGILSCCLKVLNFRLIHYCFESFPTYVLNHWITCQSYWKFMVLWNTNELFDTSVRTKDIIDLCDIMIDVIDQKELFLAHFSHDICNMNPYVLLYIIEKGCGVLRDIPVNVISDLLSCRKPDLGMIRFMRDCGYDIYTTVIKSVNDSDSFCDSIAATAKILVSTPLSLQCLCRVVVRRQLFLVHRWSGFTQKIAELMLPNTVKSFLTFEGNTF